MNNAVLQNNNEESKYNWIKLSLFVLPIFVLLVVSIFFYPRTDFLIPFTALITSFGFSITTDPAKNNNLKNSINFLPFAMIPALYILIAPSLTYSYLGKASLFQSFILSMPCIIYIIAFKTLANVNNYQSSITAFINSIFSYITLILLLIIIQRYEIEETEQIIFLSIGIFMIATNYLYAFNRKPLANFISVTAISVAFLEFWFLIKYFILSQEILVISGLIFFYFSAGLMSAELNKKLKLTIIIEYSIVTIACAIIIFYLENNQFFI
ncbi:MAG: hypothetical protein DK305_000523 [Chloroflexi bacterium]|jgi:hypothetical protein|nr:MAG: hypothetical protein DK305_000523 [Chloroflexota bacterium]|tara:strand:+ start:24 stop:827 length:804 start_codon:yes stop_codon:yes gene_type:complete